MAEKISKQEVKHIAQLANLTLEKGEVEKYQQQLSEILSYVEKLEEVDTANVPPTAQVSGRKNVTSKDEEGKYFSAQQALSQAPVSHLDYFVVQAILKQ